MKSFFNFSKISTSTLISSAPLALFYTSNNYCLDSSSIHSKYISALRSSECISDSLLENSVFVAGSGNKPLAEEVAALLGAKLGDIRMKKFNDGECQIEVHENLKGKTVYLIQPTCAPANDNLVEMLLTISTLKRLGAKVVGVVPYYGYARQDRPAPPLNPGIYSSDVAHMLENMGLDKIITLDLHSTQTLGAFRSGTDGENINGGKIGADYLASKADEIGIKNPIVVSPDAGGYARAKKFIQILKEKGGLWSDTASAMLVN